ncbi:MAG: MXAN_6640 family putative metalloprotease [Actinomycetota bacterium]
MKRSRAPLPVVLALALTLGAMPAQAGPGDTIEKQSDRRANEAPGRIHARPDALSRALERAELTPAQYALQRALSLFHPRLVERRFGDVSAPDPHMATLVLRDLALQRGQLTGEDRDAAESLLARPDDEEGGAFGERYTTSSEITCLTPPVRICVHWVTSGPDAATPEQVDATIATMETVWDVEVTQLGFRPPKADKNSQNHGPDGKTDIYLADIGSDGFYGYCTSDDPRGYRLGSARYPYYDVSAYCVIDNDFLEFPDQTPLANLQVTAAHEFFHAIQFGYDAYEDFWLLEGSATAIEDVVFNDINDNYQFLLPSQFTAPHKPLDLTSINPGGANFGRRYGAWIFFRYITEVFGLPGAPDATALKGIWDRADGSPHQQFGDMPSIKAVKKYIASKGTFFPKLFTNFAVQLRMPELFLEGVGYLSYLQSKGADHAPITRDFQLGASEPTSGKRTRTINHLGHRYYRFTRAADAAGDAGLKFFLDLPKRWKKSKATILIHSNDGSTRIKRAKLRKDGRGWARAPFGSDVISVVLILTNASTRYTKCEKRYFIYNTSCGEPKNDKLPFTFKAKVV